MHEKALPPASRKLLARLGASPPESLLGWNLAGGTGLALRMGHRLSEDFGFFRNAGMDIRSRYEALAAITPCETVQSGEHTLTVLAGGVKLSFFQIADQPQGLYRSVHDPSRRTSAQGLPRPAAPGSMGRAVSPTIRCSSA
jgi:hypothetical protein